MCVGGSPGLAPWSDEALTLTGRLFGIVANQSIDLIDTAVGPSHVWAALVPLYEAADLITQSTLDLAEPLACERLLPTGAPDGSPAPRAAGRPASVARLPWPLARYTVGDQRRHGSEVRHCSFDPTTAEPRSWIDVCNL